MSVAGIVWRALSLAVMLAVVPAARGAWPVIGQTELDGGLGIALALQAESRDDPTSEATVWRRWDHALTSTRSYGNPYADVILRVTYTGPAGQTVKGYGFWDGGDTFRIRCAFPVPGTLAMGDGVLRHGNAGLHRQRGTVRSSPIQAKIHSIDTAF